MKKLFNENKLYIFGAITGAIGGFMYWKFVGCSSGTCMITSSPRNSTLYFAMMGAIFFGMFKKEKQRAE
ncbi:MAG: hypothetical protein KGL19_14770 [Bacteroidota bacterium]|nr:hypothetical protein [Bacteroidota bacterium]